jgi:glycosyltransferase involved in cell wall biosynthesis
MHTVMIDGVEYAPMGARSAPTGRIGVGVTTRNRPDVLAQALEAWEKYLPDGAEFVIVDDASDEPAKGATYRFEQNVGVARAKNKCMELLTDRGVEHLFLFDDDTFPITADWWKPYVASPEPHLMFAWGDIHYQVDGLIGYQWPKGCMLYAERRVLDRVGGMDPVFGLWGCEHMSWSDRIHNAGLTTCRYQDVPDSHELIRSLDRWGEVTSSVPLEIREQANVAALDAARYSDAYVPYREPVAAPSRVALSVLVPSVSARRADFAPKIADALFGQHEALPAADQARVEILMLTDARGMVLGEKRNAMVRMAQGDYVVFVDDDDRIADDYLATLLAATEHGADAITFDADVSIDGGRPKRCRYSIAYAADADTATEYHRLPNHITAVRREHALATPFPAKLKGEDSAYAVRLRPLLHTEHRLDRVLYYYDFNSATTQTQQPDRVTYPPIVDIVVLSKADTDELRRMAQHTIDTARAGAGEHTVNVVVIEQQPGVRYRDAVTLHEPGEFAYNAFANKGIATGRAPWVMVANSDLEFHDGWLDALLAAKHDVVSPACPRESRQSRVQRNETGTENGKHFSGWCFMMARSLWETIGGLDEDFRFWCADDSVIEQVKAVGVLPMLVPEAKVTHLISRTVGSRALASDPEDDGSLTWAMVRRFEQKYGVAKFANDQRYKAWKARHPEPHGALAPVPA